MARDKRSFSRRTVLRASTASVGGLLAVGTASADDSIPIACPDCLSPYNINEIQIDKAVPPSVTGSVTVSKPCSAVEGHVQVFVDDVLVREEAVNLDCTEEATVDFEYTPDQPLKPGTYELRVAVPLVNENMTTEEMVEFQVPSGRGHGKGRSNKNKKWKC